MIGIIGAGITGLTAAWYLKEKGIRFRLYEAADPAGGVIQTRQEGPYRLEYGPHTVQMNDAIYPLFEGLGLDHQLIPPLPQARKRYVLRDGRYRALPTGPGNLLGSRALSLGAKIRILREPLNRSMGPAGESVDQFFRRRLGDEITDYLVTPFVGGIYAGDPRNLDMAAAFPALPQWEQEHGSLLKGMIRSRKGRTHSGAYSFYGGMGTLTKTLRQRLRFELRPGHKLLSIAPRGRGFQLTFPKRNIYVDQLLLCCPAHQLPEIFEADFPGLAAHFSRIPYAPVSLVHTAYKRAHIAHPLDGFGALHNRLEVSETLGTLFVSSLFPGRCPRDEVLLSSFVGGAIYPEKAEADEADLLQAVQADHRRFLGASEPPVFQEIMRWPQGIPQYTRAAAGAQQQIEANAPAGMWFGGNWIGGISVPSSIERGQWLAAQTGLSG